MAEVGRQPGGPGHHDEVRRGGEQRGERGRAGGAQVRQRPRPAVVVGFVVFVAAMVWQFRTPDYRTWPYWSAVAMVAVFGTMCADVMHIVFGLPYTVSTTFYAVCLAVTFIVWYRSEGTLDIHS